MSCSSSSHSATNRKKAKTQTREFCLQNNIRTEDDLDRAFQEDDWRRRFAPAAEFYSAWLFGLLALASVSPAEMHELMRASDKDDTYLDVMLNRSKNNLEFRDSGVDSLTRDGDIVAQTKLRGKNSRISFSEVTNFHGTGELFGAQKMILHKLEGSELEKRAKAVCDKWKIERHEFSESDLREFIAESLRDADPPPKILQPMRQYVFPYASSDANQRLVNFIASRKGVSNRVVIFCPCETKAVEVLDAFAELNVVASCLPLLKGCSPKPIMNWMADTDDMSQKVLIAVPDNVRHIHIPQIDTVAFSNFTAGMPPSVLKECIDVGLLESPGKRSCAVIAPVSCAPLALVKFVEAIEMTDKNFKEITACGFSKICGEVVNIEAEWGADGEPSDFANISVEELVSDAYSALVAQEQVSKKRPAAQKGLGKKARF